jgi:excisionase family DNA binding protein
LSTTKSARRHRQRMRKLRESRRQAVANPDMVPPAAVTVPEFAVLVGVSVATVYRAVAAGKIKNSKFMGRRLISFDEVERLRNGE